MRTCVTAARETPTISAISLFRRRCIFFTLVTRVTPDKFTLTAMQRVQEAILDTTILPASFRRKIADYVVETDEYVTGAGHRPAKLFMRKERND